MPYMAMSTTSAGLDLSNLEYTSQDEIDAHLRFAWRSRGPLYEQYAGQPHGRLRAGSF